MTANGDRSYRLRPDQETQVLGSEEDSRSRGITSIPSGTEPLQLEASIESTSTKNDWAGAFKSVGIMVCLTWIVVHVVDIVAR